MEKNNFKNFNLELSERKPTELYQKYRINLYLPFEKVKEVLAAFPPPKLPVTHMGKQIKFSYEYHFIFVENKSDYPGWSTRDQYSRTPVLPGESILPKLIPWMKKVDQAISWSLEQERITRHFKKTIIK